MIDEFRVDNGATRFVPGSHRWLSAPEETSTSARTVPIRSRLWSSGLTPDLQWLYMARARGKPVGRATTITARRIHPARRARGDRLRGAHVNGDTCASGTAGAGCPWRLSLVEDKEDDSRHLDRSPMRPDGPLITASVYGPAVGAPRAPTLHHILTHPDLPLA